MNPAIATAEAIARRSIPDLDGQVLYIVTPADGGMVTAAHLTHHDGCYFRGLARAIQPQLEAEGRWQGDGVAIVATESIDEMGFVGLLLHELAHWLCDDCGPGRDPAPAAEVYRDFVDFSTTAQPATPLPNVFWSHANDFIRAACHVYYRARSPRHGDYCLSPDRLCFGCVYPGLEAMSHPRAYLATLHDELQRHQHRCIRSILAEPAPADFTELWKVDQRNMYQAALERAAA